MPSALASLLCGQSDRTSRQRPAIADNDFISGEIKLMITAFRQPDLVFDACSLFGEVSGDPLIQPALGELVLRVPKEVSHCSLYQTDIGKRFMRREKWYHDYPWSNESISPGIYVLRLPVAESGNKTLDKQKELLVDGEEPAPLALVELAMLCLKNAGAPDPLVGNIVRCREIASKKNSGIDLSWHGTRLRVGCNFIHRRHSIIWLASARKVS